MRYVFLASAVALLYFVNAVEFAAVIAGLVSLAVAVTIEGIVRMFLIAFSRKEV
jgi:hypothetical protein